MTMTRRRTSKHIWCLLFHQKHWVNDYLFPITKYAMCTKCGCGHILETEAEYRERIRRG